MVPLNMFLYLYGHKQCINILIIMIKRLQKAMAVSLDQVRHTCPMKCLKVVYRKGELQKNCWGRKTIGFLNSEKLVGF